MTASTAPTIAPATYRIDLARSAIRFVSKALFGLFRVRGTFTVRDGTIVVAEDVTRCTVTATVGRGHYELATDVSAPLRLARAPCPAAITVADRKRTSPRMSRSRTFSGA